MPKGTAALFEIHNIAQEIADRGHVHRSDVMVLEEVPAKASPTLPFALDGIERLFHSVIVHYENEVPVQIEERFVNAQIAPLYLQQDFTRTTAYAYLMDLAPLTGGEHVVEAIHATSAECRLLGIKRNEACLMIRRRTWSAQGVVGCARLVYPGSRYRLQGQCGH